MKSVRRPWRRLLGSVSAGQRERELAAEVEAHLEMLIEANLRAGMNPSEARRMAALKFGGIEVMKENYRDQRGLPWLETTAADLRYAIRTLRKNPGFSLVATLILALGIGANTAVFTLVNQLLLNPPGASQPQRILVLWTKYDKLNLDFDLASPPALAAASANRKIFEHAAAARATGFSFADGVMPIRLPGAAVTAEWFDVFGARPVLGRVFSVDEDKAGAKRVAVLAYGAWLRLFGGDSGVIGQTIELDQQPYQIIGVMDRYFHQPHDVDLWVPLALPTPAFALQNWFNGTVSVVARMRPAVTFGEAEAWLRLTVGQVAAAAPADLRGLVKNWGWGMRSTRFTDSNAGATKKPIVILLVSVSLVLLIACTNIAGLMLARTSARTRELAVRAALGAGRLRLMRQIIAESLVIAVAGGASGLVLARGSMKLLLSLAPERAVAGLDARLDVLVLLFASGTTLAAGLFFGLVPAWQSSRVDPHHALKDAGRAISGARRHLQSGLVVAEAALAFVLLVAAGLLMRSFARLQDVTPGFDSRKVVTAAYTLPSRMNPQRQAIFARSVLEYLRASAGITAAAIGRPIPFSNDLEGAAFRIEGRNLAAGEPTPQGDRGWVTPDYMKVLGINLQRGRFFTDLDRADAEPVTVIDTNLARRYWANEDPLGKRIQPASGEGWYTIVGIVDHVIHSDLAADNGRGIYYVSLYQRPMPMGTILVKTSDGLPAAVHAIHEAVHAADPNMPVYDVKPMGTLLADSLAPRRFAIRVLGFFAASALFLAALGLYGVLSYTVTQRTREIGIRIALGANRALVLRLIVGEGLRLAAAGVALGIGAAVLFGRVIQSQLFEVRSYDPPTMAAVASTIMIAALLASWLPAMRAMKGDPAARLRFE